MPKSAGVAIIHQELNLVPELSVADNIFLGREPLIAGMLIDRRRMVKAAERLLHRLGVDIAPESRIADLRVGEQQLVEIAKALSLDARILIMDEPTSALSSSECETLFKVVRQLAERGRRDHLHLAPDRRGARSRRSGDGAARRQTRADGADRRLVARRDHLGDGRPRHGRNAIAMRPRKTARPSSPCET